MDRECPERILLIELDRASPVQLEEGKEAGDNDSTRLGILNELMEGHGTRLSQHRTDDERLFAHGHDRVMQVSDLHRRCRGRQRIGREAREVLGRREPAQLGKKRRKMRLQGHVPGDVRAVLPHPLINILRCFLERAILQKPGKQQITGLQIGLRGVVLLVNGGQ